MGRRLYDDIRILILMALSKGQSTINKISKDTSINWKTVENHLVYLLGKGYVSEIFKSEYVRIFEITKEGKEHIAKLKSEKMIELTYKDEIEKIADCGELNLDLRMVKK